MDPKEAPISPSLVLMNRELESGANSQSSGQMAHVLSHTNHVDPRSQSWGIKNQSQAPVQPTQTSLFSSTSCWTAKTQRKQPCKLHVPHPSQPRHTRPDDIPSRVGRMGRLEVENISWWVAQAFTWGSVVWVVNGFVGFLPFVTSIQGEAMILAEGWTAFVGATIFEMGSVLGILEAWNRDDALHSGRGAEKPLDNASYVFGKHRPDGTNLLPVRTADVTKKWVWFSADARYFRKLDFHAAFWQLLGATIFWISGFMAIPPIQSVISQHTPVLNGAFWTPQVIGGSGFIISSIFTMLEAQTVWWKPAVWTVGWQAGVWNLVGAIGFTLCGTFGFFASENHGLEYQSSLCAFWAGWAFLIGSLFQWYECVNLR